MKLYLSNIDYCLGVVLLEETLEVEEMNLSLLGYTKELTEFVVRVNNLTISLILKTVLLHVCRNTLVHLSASDELTGCEAEELGEVSTDGHGLGETVRLALPSSGSLATATTTLRHPQLAGRAGRELAKASRESSKLGAHSSHLSQHLSELVRKGRLRGLLSGGGNLNNLIHQRSGLSGSGNNGFSDSVGLLGSGVLTSHLDVLSGLYSILYIRNFFLSDLTQ